MISHNYSENEIEDIIRIFALNKVKIEFETKDQIIKTVNSVGKQINKISSTKHFENTRLIKLLEYDMADMHVISNGIGYPLRFVDHCPIKNIKECIDNVLIIFSDFDGIILDFMSNFGMIFAKDKEKEYEGCYFWINREIFLNVTTETKPNFLERLFVDPNHSAFICAVDDYEVLLDYIGFNAINDISKYAFIMPVESFFARNPEKFYGDFKNFDKVIKVIEKQRKFSGISFQLAPIAAEYMAIEVPVDLHELQNYLNHMIDIDLIDQETYDRVWNFKYDVDANSHYMIKFRWYGKQKFQIKIYTEKYLNPIPPGKIQASRDGTKLLEKGA